MVQAQARTEPNNIDAQERYIDLMHSIGLGQTAAQNMRVRAAAEPNSALAMYLLGRAVLSPEDAEEAYLKCLALDPGFARAHMGLGAVRRGTGLHKDAEADYRTALAGDPSLGEAWAGLSAALLSQGKVDAARIVARDAVLAVPGDPDAWLALALLEPGSARMSLLQARTHIKDDPRIFAALAEEELLLGNGAAALVAAEAALALDPGHTGAELSRMFAVELKAGRLDGAAYRSLLIAQELETREPAESVRRYNELVLSHPESPLVWMARARVRQATDPTGAVQDLQFALERDPENVEALAVMGLLLVRVGLVAEARPYLDAAATARPHDASLAMHAARAAQKSGDVPAALARMEEAAGRHLTSVEVVLLTAQLRSESGDLDGAYALLQERAPDLPDVRIGLALAASAKDLGRIEEAATILERLGEITGNPVLGQAAAELRAAAP